MRVESESSHESLGSVLESSQVTSHRGLESSRVESHKVVESCPSQTLYSIFCITFTCRRRRPYCLRLTKLINRKRDRMLSVYVEK